MSYNLGPRNRRLHRPAADRDFRLVMAFGAVVQSGLNDGKRFGMSIIVPPELEMKIRGRAEAEGLSVEAYVEQLVRADQRRIEELDRPDADCGKV